MPEPDDARSGARDTLQYLLPDLGEGMSEAEVLQWRVAVGEHVTRDQIVVHVQTDKAEVELPVPASGTITALGAAVGDMVPVGAPLLELVPDDGAVAPGTQVRASTVPQPRPAAPSAAADAGGGAIPQTAPPVRKLARELGVDLATVAGSGPGGRITAADVRAAATAPEAAPEAASAPASTGTRAPLRGIRRAMARNMADAWRQVPHISLFDEIDARPLLAAHAAARASAPAEIPGGTLTLTAFFVRAAVVALRDVPVLNVGFDAAAEEVVSHDACHVGIAVATDAGLVVPVLHDAHTKDLAALGAEITALTAAARSGGLAPAQLQGATFTVTNFGTEGGRFATPIVRPPQVAILGFGAVRVRPVVDGDAVVAAPSLPISLSADHRVVDGHDATTFLERVAALLAAPEGL
jgi:pyruvate/2-oxoglutarate dehydrogenase complex dihydrolipoamide acyltransferase (E2) component